MDDAMKSAGWIILGAAAAAYVTFLIADMVLHPKEVASPPMVIRDAITSGEHHLTGAIYVNASCDQLEVSTKKISTNVYELVFVTWRDPAVTCSDEPSLRGFETVVFAPSIGVKFVATLDKNPLAIAVYPMVVKN